MPIDNPSKVILSRLIYPEIIEQKHSIKVLDTVKNLEWLLAHFKTKIRYNLMSRQREIEIPGYSIFNDDKENAALHLIDYLATLNEMPTTKLDAHLDVIAYQNCYHPIVEMLKRNPWDGVHRLSLFIKTLEAKSPELAEKIITTWMVSAIAAAHSIDGFMNHGVLVLLGEQNIGKTRWVKSLDPINCNAVKESAFLDPTNKDSVLHLAKYWICELGELDSIFSKSEIGRLKSFITTQADLVRAAYARKAALIPRRTAYVATVNDDKYLIDTTGNRRWWTIEVKSIDLNHQLDMIQVWAEAYNYWQSGHPTYLTQELQGLVNQNNSNHEPQDPFEEMLIANYDWSSDSRRLITATQLLIELGYRSPTKSELNRISKILRRITKKEPKKMRDGRFHEIPIHINPPFTRV